ncbi:hypothetical protein KKA66_02040, partial [Patescibacteria group bacterium]|nr:hypothetical protein [Patescibacteria group bacterium]
MRDGLKKIDWKMAIIMLPLLPIFAVVSIPDILYFFSSTEKEKRKQEKQGRQAKNKKILNELTIAEELISGESTSVQIAQAEKIFLKIIIDSTGIIDPYAERLVEIINSSTNMRACLGLAKVYFKQKDFENSKELFEYVFNENKNRDA